MNSKSLRKQVTTPLRRDNYATKRNAKCPCGSGKKYKKCCLIVNKTFEKMTPEQRQEVLRRLEERNKKEVIQS